MAVAFGKINSFNPSQDEWPLYVERLGHVFVANEITEEDKKRAIFLSVIGASTYELLSSLLAPVKPGEKSYTFLIDKLSKHFTPAPSEIVERFKFHTRFCKPGESVTAFVSELRSLAKSCNFGDTLETMLRDRIVCGINDTIIIFVCACMCLIIQAIMGSVLPCRILLLLVYPYGLLCKRKFSNQ